MSGLTAAFAFAIAAGADVLGAAWLLDEVDESPPHAPNVTHIATAIAVKATGPPLDLIVVSLLLMS